jgi:phosphoserine phosphatase
MSRGLGLELGRKMGRRSTEGGIQVNRSHSSWIVATLLLLLLATACRTEPAPVRSEPPAAAPATAVDPLPSWNEGAAKKAIVDFVGRVTREGGSDFVPAPERIATFDNDGTLWSEKPVPFQVIFAFDRVKALAPEHPEWKTRQPFASILAGDMAGVAASGEKGLLSIVAATHTGMTTDDFASAVQEWIATAKHPQTGQLFTGMVYQPMLEVLAYLRANAFKTFIVSGGGVEFMRVWAERVYGIPPEQVVGSSGKLKLEDRDGKPVLVKLPEIDLIDDKEGKPVGIQRQIGRRPIAAFGNSDGDLPMLQWVTAGPGARFALFVHHDDGVREFAYDRTDKLQQFNKGWDEALAKGWTVVSMKDDWKTVFPSDNTRGAAR